MRSLLLIVAAVVVAVAGFTAYIWWQDPGAGVGGSPREPLAPSPMQATSGGVASVGTAKGIVVKMLGKDGEVTAIFRAKEYVPLETRGDADVIGPEYEFFLKNGRRLTLTGEKGSVNLEERRGRSTSGLGGDTTAAPTHGQLYDVTIRIYEPEMDRPSLTLTTNNVSFDNQTFRIATEKYTDADGKDIPADQVAVTIRGDDVDFDGRGLTLRYDDLNQQIAMLQIAHGERIVVKNPKVIAGARNARPKATPAEPATAPAESPVATRPAAPPPVAETPATQPAPQTPYRVTLRKDVRIYQGDTPMAEADIVQIDFRPEGVRPAEPGRTTRPAPATTTASTTAPATAPATAPTQVATTAPATQPAEQPIVIRWTGPLQMVALKDKDPIAPLGPGDMAVTASGSPLVLHQTQGTVVAASMIFRSADSSVSFYNGETAPRVTFSDAKNETRLTSLQVDYNDQTKTAVLLGASNLHMKLPSTRPTTQPHELAASWVERCVVKLDDTGAARQIDLHGKVSINHPQMKLKSDALSLGLEPDPRDKSKAVLKTATATGNVDADLSDATNLGRKVTSQKLVVTMEKGPDGQMFARRVDAEGSVNAVDAQQSLQADRVQLVLKPKSATTQPAATRPAGEMASVDLESFLAEGSVLLKGKDASGKADRIAVSTADGRQLIELTGQPATLTQQGRTITGPSILARPDDGYALIDGAGSLKADGSATTRPADMTWANRAELDAANNRITFTGQIRINTTDADGTVITATGDECVVTLRDAPTTRPVEKQESLRNKAIASIALMGKVVADSELIAGGKLVKRSSLRADRVNVGLDDQQKLASIDIPGAGQMLHEDRSEPRADQDQPVGAIAIQWSKSFRMDQKPDPLATFTGDVRIARLEKPDAPESEVMRLNASRVRISFEPAAPATRPTAATRPTTRRALVAGIRQVDASAPVVYEYQTTRILAQSLLYTPASNLVVLLGNEGQPVQWYNDNASQGTFTELWYDLEKQEARFKRPTIQARP